MARPPGIPQKFKNPLLHRLRAAPKMMGNTLTEGARLEYRPGRGRGFREYWERRRATKP